MTSDEFETSFQDGEPFSVRVNTITINNFNELTVEFRVLNTTLEEKKFSFTSSCQSGLKIQKGDNVLWDRENFYGCLAALTSFTLGAGKTKVFSFEFDRLDGFAKEALRDIEPGTYKLRAFLLNEQSPEVSQEITLQ